MTIPLFPSNTILLLPLVIKLGLIKTLVMGF